MPLKVALWARLAAGVRYPAMHRATYPEIQPPDHAPDNEGALVRATIGQVKAAVSYTGASITGGCQPQVPSFHALQEDAVGQHQRIRVAIVGQTFPDMCW